MIGNIAGGIVTRVSEAMDGQKWSGNAGHFHTLVKIIYFVFFFSLLASFKFRAQDCNYFYSPTVTEK